MQISGQKRPLGSTDETLEEGDHGVQALVNPREDKAPMFVDDPTSDYPRISAKLSSTDPLSLGARVGEYDYLSLPSNLEELRNPLKSATLTQLTLFLTVSKQTNRVFDNEDFHGLRLICDRLNSLLPIVKDKPTQQQIEYCIHELNKILDIPKPPEEPEPNNPNNSPSTQNPRAKFREFLKKYIR